MIFCSYKGAADRRSARIKLAIEIAARVCETGAAISVSYCHLYQFGNR